MRKSRNPYYAYRRLLKLRGEHGVNSGKPLDCVIVEEGRGGTQKKYASNRGTAGGI